jgi:hypothetical protein
MKVKVRMGKDYVEAGVISECSGVSTLVRK